MRRKRPAFHRLDLAILSGILGLLLGLLAPAMQSARKADARARCTDNFRELGKATHSFEQRHGYVPPSAVYAEGNRRSWATYLLADMGHEKLARQYHGDADWSDPVNAKVIQTPVALLRCPAAPDRDKGKKWTTGDYAAVRNFDGLVFAVMGLPTTMDRDGLFRRDRTSRLDEVSDGLAHTLMFVENAGRPQWWTAGKRNERDIGVEWGAWASHRYDFEPRGHSFDGMSDPGPCGVNCSNHHGVYSFHDGFANVCMGDGSVRPLRAGLDSYVLLALVTARGGETVCSTDY